MKTVSPATGFACSVGRGQGDSALLVFIGFVHWLDALEHEQFLSRGRDYPVRTVGLVSSRRGDYRQLQDKVTIIDNTCLKKINILRSKCWSGC